ncbi:MAG TPA: phosphoenolpyruvate synthase, partial [Desulfurococcaceae archaeon]|nr:phosphoenolpyruvate synthase [Desulfurococcaceae archaeon]
PIELYRVSREVRRLIENADYPEDLREAIAEAYRKLGEMIKWEEPYVATRSSGTFEDIATASFAGQHESYLYVKGIEELLYYIRKCFSSLYTPRAIFYKHQKGIPLEKEAISVGVQVMVDAKVSGVMFTLDPLTGDRDYIVIEGSWGIGEAIVQGKVTPDRFKVDKRTLKIVEKKISQKKIMMTRDPSKVGELKTIELSDEEATKPCLSEEQVIELAKLGLKIEELYGRPQDIEWAIHSRNNKIYIVQSRPETVWSIKRVEEAAKETKIIVRGLGASPGIASGKAHVILDITGLGKFKEGEILVTKMTTPDWVPAMRKAVAIVTDGGGMTAHAAIVSRELGIPCVVGTGNATQVIKTGMDITVDGTKGLVYSGILKPKAVKPKVEEEVVPTKPVKVEVPIITATKIYMNLGVPDKIHEYKDLPFDGIGLMRIEFIIAEWIRKHPLALIEEGNEEFFINKLAEGIAMVAKEIYPRPVVVRLSDFKTNEYAKLEGGEKYEATFKENNPMLGFRGASRYISKHYEAAFRLELRAIKKCREEFGLKNVWIMLPFVRTTWEVKKVLEIMKEEGLERSRDLKVWLMAEVPSNVILADEFAKLCDGFSIGSNDLTSLILGVDRDSSVLGELGYFDERDPAVLRAIKTLIETAHKHGTTVSI